jgi:NhaA family Na+:H+ antiporter
MSSADTQAPDGSAPRRRTLGDMLRAENTGGILLAITAVVALAWVNSPLKGSYDALRDWTFGPASLGLHMSFEHWAADGLLTVFFFLVGLELKREFTVGELRTFSKAMLPVVAAVGGMTAPALIYLTLNLTSSAGQTNGWAVPVATDIAFSVAVMGLASRHVPRSLRIFLLTLAVADDLLGIVVIALFYNTGGLKLWWLAGCLAGAAAFGLVIRKGITNPLVLVPIAVIAWYCMHQSGVHSTICGVLLGFAVPAKTRDGGENPVGARIAFKLSPLTYGLIVPVFALMTAGVSFDPNAIAEAVRDPVAQGVALGLVFGKPIGILAATGLATHLTKARIDSRLNWLDILAMGEVAGIGFTVSLLINELAFTDAPIAADHGTMAVLTGSLVAAVLGTCLMAWRSRVHARAAGARGEQNQIPDGTQQG